MTRAPRGQFTHGTQSGYNKYRCRCPECSATQRKATCQSCGGACSGTKCRACRRAAWVRECESCGGVFFRDRGRFCSLRCANDHAAAIRPPRSDSFWRPSPTWRKRAIESLVARDGARCQMCGDRIDMSLSGRNPLMVSIDHVVPRSEGGSDDLSNLRLVHFGENSSRGNRGGFEQLALVG